MVKSNVNALGIIFPNSYDNMVPELVTERLMAFHSLCRTLSYDRLYPFKHGKQRN